MSPHSGVVGRQLYSPPCVNGSLTWTASAGRAVNIRRKHTPTAGWAFAHNLASSVSAPLIATWWISIWSSVKFGGVRWSGALSGKVPWENAWTTYAASTTVLSFSQWEVWGSLWHAALRRDLSGVAVDVKLFHEAGCQLVHKYRIYVDPLLHPALRGEVLRQLLGVNRAMAIAQLTHLHLTIPSSGTTSEPVPPECFLVVPLAKGSALSRRVSFARDVSIIDSSPLLFSPVEEPVSASVLPDTDLDTIERDDI